MSIYDQTELLDAVKNWKDAGLPFNEWSHPSVVLNSPAYWLLRQLLKQSSSVEAPVEAEPSGPADPLLFQQGKWDLGTPGEATYEGVRFPIEGQSRKLLARLVRGKGKAVRSRELKDACDNGEMEDSTLRGYICRLRGLLRKYFPAAKVPDPITNHDPDSYRLNLS